MATKLNTDQKTVIRELKGNRITYICPKCKQVLHIKTKYKKNLCMNCGQYLNWDPLEEQWYTTYFICENQDEANYYHEAYKKFSGNDIFKSGVFSDRSNKLNCQWPKGLMFIFLEKKGYGRFMRWLAKERSD